jgi:hypothetical protein
MKITMNVWDVVDETWTRNGLLRVVRKGNGYQWQVYGQNNFETPVFTGESGHFFDALKAGEIKLEKDLKQIFLLLNEASQKERREQEPGDAELIEQVIRNINAGEKSVALHILNKIIEKEVREREPNDVKRLALARTLLQAEDLTKEADDDIEETQSGGEPAQPAVSAPSGH